MTERRHWLVQGSMKTHCYVNDTPNSPLSVFFKDGAHVCGVRQVAPVGINSGRLFLRL